MKAVTCDYSFNKRLAVERENSPPLSPTNPHILFQCQTTFMPFSFFVHYRLFRGIGFNILNSVLKEIIQFIHFNPFKNNIFTFP